MLQSYIFRVPATPARFSTHWIRFVSKYRYEPDSFVGSKKETQQDSWTIYTIANWKPAPEVTDWLTNGSDSRHTTNLYNTSEVSNFGKKKPKWGITLPVRSRTRQRSSIYNTWNPHEPDWNNCESNWKHSYGKIPDFLLRWWFLRKISNKKVVINPNILSLFDVQENNEPLPENRV